MRIIPTRMWCGWGGLLYGILLLYLYSGVPLLHSRDLVHWELINHCVKKLPLRNTPLPCHGSGTWAPSIRYHEGTFFVFIPLVDEGILVARSKDPYGEFEWNMLCESKGWIDPCPFWDDDGRAYMVFAYAKSRSGIKTPAVAGGNRSSVPLPSDRAQAYI